MEPSRIPEDNGRPRVNAPQVINEARSVCFSIASNPSEDERMRQVAFRTLTELEKLDSHLRRVAISQLGARIGAKKEPLPAE